MRNGPLRGPFSRPSGVGGIKNPCQTHGKTRGKTHGKSVGRTDICRTDGHLSDGRTKSVGRTDKICRTDGHNLSDGRTHSNAPEKTHYIRKTFLFMLRSAPKLFYYHQLGERIPKMGLDLKSVHGKGSNFVWTNGQTNRQNCLTPILSRIWPGKKVQAISATQLFCRDIRTT